MSIVYGSDMFEGCNRVNQSLFHLTLILLSASCVKHYSATFVFVIDTWPSFMTSPSHSQTHPCPADIKQVTPVAVHCLYT